jgi:mono/diheme cytochrome c family protein
MMRTFRSCWTLVIVAALSCAGCARVPGIPQAGPDVVRPDKELDFHVLYKQNCSGCHGENGRGGAAIPLNNPAYLAVAGAENLRTATAKGMAGTSMPAFAQSSGGMLTDQQVDALVQGMVREWGRPSDFSGVELPAYSASAPGDANAGQKTYVTACSRCHGVDGTGIKTPGSTTTGQLVETPHSIIDISYLALVNDQNLRSYVIAGHLDDKAPDWRSYVPGRALTSQEITNIVAWIASHRAPVAEQSIENPRTTPPGVAKEKP